MGRDLYMNIPEEGKSNHLKDFRDFFSLENFIKFAVCTKGPRGTALKLIVTNISKYFHHTCMVTADVNYCHKSICYLVDFHVYHLKRYFTDIANIMMKSHVVNHELQVASYHIQVAI